MAGETKTIQPTGSCLECCCPVELVATSQCCEGATCVSCGSTLGPTVTVSADCSGDTTIKCNTTERLYYRPDSAEDIDHRFQTTWPASAGVYFFEKQRITWTVGAVTRTTGWMNTRVGRIIWPYGAGDPATMTIEAVYRRQGPGCFDCGRGFVAEVDASGTMGRLTNIVGSAPLVDEVCPSTYRHASAWSAAAATKIFCPIFGGLGDCRADGYAFETGPATCTDGLGPTADDFCEDGSGCVYRYTFRWYIVHMHAAVRCTWVPGSAGKVTPTVSAWVNMGANPGGFVRYMDRQLISGASPPCDPSVGFACGIAFGSTSQLWYSAETTGPEIDDTCTAIRNWFDGTHTLSPVPGDTCTGNLTVQIWWPP